VLVRWIAQREQITESALVKQLLEVMMRSSVVEQLPPAEEKVKRYARLSVRLEPGDRLLLCERAAARGLPTATYASVVIRSYLRALAPLLKVERALLNRAIGRTRRHRSQPQPNRPRRQPGRSSCQPGSCRTDGLVASMRGAAESRPRVDGGQSS
jgi:hypothetical protein